eukprot:11699126-Karenia_brevis.AAC.1
MPSLIEMATMAGETIPKEGKDTPFNDEQWNHHKKKVMEFVLHIQNMISQNIRIEYQHVSSFYGYIRDAYLHDYIGVEQI